MAGLDRLPKRDLLGPTALEWYKVPAFVPSPDWKGRFMLGLRYLVDPAAASIRLDLARLLANEDGEFLDVGCGAQPYRALLPAGARYQGIDRKETREAFGYDLPDTLYYEGDRWPVEDASKDCILCTEVLEHVPDPEAFLRQAHRCLKPGGRLILTVPFSARVHYQPHDYFRYTPFGLKELTRRAGFADIRVWGRGNPLTVACSKILGLILPFLMRGAGGALNVRRVFAMLLLGPLGFVVGLIARASIDFDFGDDAIGFTALVIRAPQEKKD